MSTQYNCAGCQCSFCITDCPDDKCSDCQGCIRNCGNFVSGRCAMGDDELEELLAAMDNGDYEDTLMGGYRSSYPSGNYWGLKPGDRVISFKHGIEGEILEDFDNRCLWYELFVVFPPESNPKPVDIDYLFPLPD